MGVGGATGSNIWRSAIGSGVLVGEDVSVVERGVGFVFEATEVFQAHQRVAGPAEGGRVGRVVGVKGGRERGLLGARSGAHPPAR